MSNKDQNGDYDEAADSRLKSDEEKLLATGVYHSSRHDNNYGLMQMPVQPVVKKRSEIDSKDCGADRY